MSGHSKFANIKHKKEKNDAAKGKIFTMIGREIAVAVKEGGPDPANNFKLAQVIAKAKSNNLAARRNLWYDTQKGEGGRIWNRYFCRCCTALKTTIFLPEAMASSASASRRTLSC